MLTLAGIINAFGVTVFLAPVKLYDSGISGTSMLLGQLTPDWLSLSVFLLVLNIPLFLYGLKRQGGVFTVYAIFTVGIYSLAAWLITDILPIDVSMASPLAGTDLLLCALFGGLCIGASLAMITRLGASTGGMDIPPLILNKKIGIPVSVSMYTFDFAILAGQMFFSERQASLYGILLVMVYTVTLDKLLTLGSGRTKVEIISREPEKLRKSILERMDRGVTMLHARTGYLGIETDILYCVISPRELHRLEMIIRGEDPEAFIVLSKASSVYGRGFSLEKKYI
jgi:uncharacterized membrane-anchored protein YitT (DUF2179 family)